jgi:hypothetical protein
MTRSRPLSGERDCQESPKAKPGGRRSHDSPEATLERETITTRLRPSPGGTGIHYSSEAKPGQQMQSRLIRGQARVPDTVTTRLRPIWQNCPHPASSTSSRLLL